MSAAGVSCSLREGGKGPSSVRVASLCNLGNTCFLNSVLYTLRFTPGFSHSIHHLAADLSQRAAAAAASRSPPKAQNGGSNNGNTEIEVIEKLHELFRSLKSADELEAREPVPPSSFLQSVSKLNPMFEGNRQQDAHELLMMILDMLQEIRVPPEHSENGHSTPKESESVPTAKKGYKRWKSSSNSSSSSTSASSNPASSSSSGSNNLLGSSSSPSSKLGGDLREVPNFIKENFVGKAVMSTRCMECEMSTYRSEPFTNIDIALQFEDEEDLVGKELFLKKIMASETLKENNKYWCEECSRLNEATRSVSYELLPKIMVLQLKRFTGSRTYMSKINDYIPTPFSMDCFCTTCNDTNNTSQPPHTYRLYAVIMHLGGTLASGHYISYVRASVQTPEYSECRRGGSSSNSVEQKNIRNSGNGSGSGSSRKPWIMKYFSKNKPGTSSSPQSCSLPSPTPPHYSSDSNGHLLNGGIGSHSTPFKSHIGGSSSSSSSNGTHHNHTLNNSPCRSYLCCGLKSLQLDARGDLGSSNESLGEQTQPPSSLNSQRTNEEDDYWLECDDENINAISRKQFEELLSAKQGATTPYLLFYQKY